jgi:hypothetical protein
LGHVIIYIVYSIGVRAEPCGTPACVSLGINISPLTETEFSMRKKRANELDYNGFRIETCLPN